MRNNIPSYIVNFLNTLASKPQITYLKNDYNLITLNKYCVKYFGDDVEKWNEIIINYLSSEETYINSCCALFLTILFLEKTLLADQCLKLGSFNLEEYQSGMDTNGKLGIKKRLIMDYQAITNLELTETKLDPKNAEAGSLLEYMNRAETYFGKRMFRTWVLNPLTDPVDIHSRLDMVEDFINNYELLNSFRTALKKWPDVERLCSKIYKSAQTSSSKAVYFEDVSKNRLVEFFNVINFLKKSIDIFRLFDSCRESGKIKSPELIKKTMLCTDHSYEGIHGVVPNIRNILMDFEENFHVSGDSENLMVEPKSGVSEEYDKIKERIANIYQELEAILLKERKRLKCPVIQWAHTKFYKYELEIPEEFVSGNKRPNNYTLTTSKKGVMRFHTSEIVDIVTELTYLRRSIKRSTKINKFDNF